jgi:hypothetical protein
MTTTTHTLQFTAGRLTVTFTETPEAVFVGLTGARARGCELPKLRRFLAPLLDAYRDDPRRLEISGEHCTWTGHVCPVTGGWIGFQAPPHSGGPAQ